MSAAPRLQPISIDEYLDGEVHAKEKHEYVEGAVYAMAGGSNNHSLIATNATVSFGGQLRGKLCRVFNSDTKVRVRTSRGTRFYYPELSVVYQPNHSEDTFQDSPAVIVEVISASTRRTDEHEKRESYLTIGSLSAYILIEQKSPSVRVYRRCENGFVPESYTGLDAIVSLPEIECSLALADVYEAVNFPTPEQIREQEEHYQLTGEMPVEFVF